MNAWVIDRLVQILNYRLDIILLEKGWYFFHFLSLEDAQRILRDPWVQGHSYLLPQRWKDGFNPLVEPPGRKLVWAKLLSLPLELWNPVAVEEIANSDQEIKSYAKK